MSNQDLHWIANYIWGIADDVLRDLYVRRASSTSCSRTRPTARAGRPTWNAWYQADTVKTGYEISFTRYFYKPKPMRTLVEIRADILALEKDTDGLLAEIPGHGEPASTR